MIAQNVSIDEVKNFLSHYITEDNIIVPLKSQNKTSVLKELLQCAYQLHWVNDFSYMLNLLEEREAIMSTGLGNGIAIPHVKDSSISDVHCVLGLSHRGINFKALDKKKSYIFILLLSPDSDAKNKDYLQLISYMNIILHDSSIRHTIIHSKNSTELKNIFV